MEQRKNELIALQTQGIATLRRLEQELKQQKENIKRQENELYILEGQIRELDNQIRSTNSTEGEKDGEATSQSNS